MKSKELKLYPAIRWTGRFAKRGLVQGSILIRFLEDNGIPAHWILPCYPVLEKALYFPLVEEIRSRIHSQTDHLLPMGYSGAVHTMLRLPELARELQWCRHNPWKSGVRDVFGVDPSFLFPTVADLYRGKARRLYRRKGFTGIGMVGDAADPERFRRVIGLGPDALTVTSLPVLSVGSRGRPISLGECRGQPARRLLLLDLDTLLLIDESDITGELREAMGELSRRRVLTFHKLLTGLESFQRDVGASEPRQTGPPDEVPPYDLHADPLIRSLGARALTLRGRGEPSVGKYRGLLWKMSAHQLLAVASRTSGPSKSFPDPSRQAVAAMGGNASLRGSRFTVHFQAGRLAGIEENGNLVGIPGAASSYLVAGAKKLPFSPTGIFSVEGEEARGLRCLESIEGGTPELNASLISDYFMVGDFPLLLVTTLIRYPAWERGFVTAVPHGIDLYRLERGEGCAIEGVYPDGTHYRLMFADRKQSQSLPASLFFLKPEGIPNDRPGIILGFPPKREALAGTVTFTIQRRKKYAVLRAAPNAGFGQADRFCNVEELFNFYLGTSLERPAVPPKFPPSVLREMPRHHFGRVG